MSKQEIGDWSGIADMLGRRRVVVESDDSFPERKSVDVGMDSTEQDAWKFLQATLDGKITRSIEPTQGEANESELNCGLDVPLIRAMASF